MPDTNAGPGDDMAPLSPRVHIFLPRTPDTLQQAPACIASLLGLAKLPKQALVLLRPQGARDTIDALIERLGLPPKLVTPITAAGTDLGMLSALAAIEDTTGRHILMSAAMVVTRPLDFTGTGLISGKIVDRANPPTADLEALFRAADLPFGQPVAVSLSPKARAERTQGGNLSTRLLALDGGFIRTLSPLWQRWARWCSANQGLLGTQKGKIEQISLALALADLGTAPELLPLSANMPAHQKVHLLPAGTPNALFLHNQRAPAGKLKLRGHPGIDEAIKRINRLLDQIQIPAATAPTPAATPRTRTPAKATVQPVPTPEPAPVPVPTPVPAVVAARPAPQVTAEVATFTPNPTSPNAAIAAATLGFKAASILHLGLKDTALIRQLHRRTQRYNGLDAQAGRVATLKRDLDGVALRSAPFEPFGHLPKADLVVSVDAPFNRDDVNVYLADLKSLVAATTRRLILRGYDYAPTPGQAYHGSLLDHLRQLKAFRSVTPLWRDKAEVILMADLFHPGADKEAELKSGDAFVQAATLAPNAAHLVSFSDLAHDAFGFFTTDFTRAIELPWIAGRISALDHNTRHLDLGTGVSPLPLYTACHGASVTTVDAHQSNKTPPYEGAPDVAGYVDYRTLSPRVQSVQATLAHFKPEAAYDLITAVAVLHELAPQDREDAVKKLRAGLNPGGDAFLSVRLIKDSDWLWPFAGGKQRARKELHGHLAQLRDMLAAAGLRIVDEEFLRSLPLTVNDTWLAHVRRI